VSHPLRQRLESSLHSASASGRQIATFMLANLNDLPFETSATLAQL